MTSSEIDTVISIAMCVVIISSISMVIISYLNNKRFIEVCRLYELEFGTLPLSAAALKDADIIGFTAGYSVKISFIINPLIYNKKSVYSKNDDISFMRNLPVNIKRWFIAEHLLSILCVAFLIVVGVFICFR
ncbi:hypothetical protein [Yersinia rochesterensis]|uniref:hypothetical protein n=1 Tax=Yersinia rochesterensis TaxID=1604335 RepID=UPI00119E3417|nr:hypothetical protein [Yersinia rochesterensis]